MMTVKEALEAWQKGCFEQRLALEVHGYHCPACAAALIS